MAIAYFCAMRRYIFLVAWMLILTGCTSVSKEDTAKLNGYWQIEKVITADGDEKPYQGNTSYDFFEIKNDKGTRTKVMPQLDGSFQTNNLQEHISVVFEDGNAYLDYTTEYAKWREEIKSLTAEKLVLLNAQDIEYHYKKAGPIKLE